MKKLMFWTVLLTMITSFTISPLVLGADKNYYSKYLSVAEVEKASGMKGIVAKHSYSLHFSNSKGTEILIVRFYKSETFDTITKDKSWTSYTGVGDKAKIAIPNMPYTIAFTKGENMAEVLSLIDPSTMKAYFTVDQLKAICKIIETRIAGKATL